MLDTTLFNINLPPIEINVNKPGDTSLILTGCRVELSENIVYSELDELNYYSLNCNDYNYGRADIELSYENVFKNPYSNYWIQCVSIRADNQIICKINNNPKIKHPHYTKITKEGKVALGIGYYFKNDEERSLLMNCNSFCIEGFIAISRKNNIYGFMCRVNRTDDSWVISEGNTYRTYKNKKNIKNLVH